VSRADRGKAYLPGFQTQGDLRAIGPRHAGDRPHAFTRRAASAAHEAPDRLTVAQAGTTSVDLLRAVRCAIPIQRKAAKPRSKQTRK